jgi:hypothetical protein
LPSRYEPCPVHPCACLSFLPTARCG